MKITYRGYDVEHDPKRGWLVTLAGKLICAQPSEDFAFTWIDQEKKRLASMEKAK